MADGKLNQTAQRQQEDRKKRLAQALRANMVLRKRRVRGEIEADDTADAKQANTPLDQDQ